MLEATGAIRVTACVRNLPLGVARFQQRPQLLIGPRVYGLAALVHGQLYG